MSGKGIFGDFIYKKKYPRLHEKNILQFKKK